ncbi:hypothetical protein QFC19_009303 [Naganishia cerealis]|uniref:Uncharacterized protein n=1 Tax=Naganishia cerealis TaxID=610337 RepID=A0ACC2UXB5_9TREE|nr:hypothetical protein QFC19_009303 [Naganishia cerealis]
MSTNDIVPNGLLVPPRKQRIPSPSTPRTTLKATPRALSKQHLTKPGTVLKPVCSNLFYQPSATSKSTTPARTKTLIGSREANEWQKRKATEQDAGVPWMLGKPMNSGKGFVAHDGGGAFPDSSPRESKRRRLAPVDTNSPRTVSVITVDPNKSPKPTGKGKRQVPLFMPGPSPTKLTSTQVTDMQAKALLDGLLEGLDAADMGLFDDDLDLETVDHDPNGDIQLGEDGLTTRFTEKDAPRPCAITNEIKVEETEFKMCEWMKVGQTSSVKHEPSVSPFGNLDSRRGDSHSAAADIQLDITAEVKNDAGHDTDSEYADEFDYDTIDLKDLDLVTNHTTGGETATPTLAVDVNPISSGPAADNNGPISTYPILNPPLHDLSNSGVVVDATYDALPWRRCIVESVSVETDEATQRFSQPVKVVNCRVVDSFAVHGGVGDAIRDEGGSVKVGTVLRCCLKGEWTDLVLASGECSDVITPNIGRHLTEQDFRFDDR